jgi:imidazole glycerol-phosphate synthase subunit HisH
MQMLLESSSEFGEHPGLGIIPGKVLPIPDAGNNGELHKIPHIGWNKIYSKGEDRNPAWKRSVLTGTPSNASVYFVHSYMVVPDRPENNLAICDYDGISICAAVKKDNVYGTQFHPEKSGEIGLEVINQFLHL